MAAARDSSCSSRELVEEISRKGKSAPGSFQPLSTDAVGSPAAARGLGHRVESAERLIHHQGCGLSPGSAQKFLSTHAAVYNTFNVQRHLISAQTHRALRGVAMTTWRTAVAAA